MSSIRDLWNLVSLRYVTPAGVIAVAQLHDTLATAQGYARPSNVREPRTWDTGTRATGDEVEAWSTWYNDAATRGGLPTTSVIEGNAATGRTWSDLLTLARSRGVVVPVQAFFSTAAASWQTMFDSARDPSLNPGAIAAQVQRTVEEAERAEQAWWYQRLGGPSGTPAPFPRGDSTPTMQPTTPPAPTPTTGGTSFNIDGGTILKGAALYLAFKALSKRRGGRR